MTASDISPEGGAFPLEGGGAHGVGRRGARDGGSHPRRVLVSNSRSRAVMEVKIDNLTRQVERHNCLVEHTYALEQDVAVVKAEIDNLRKGQ